MVNTPLDMKYIYKRERYLEKKKSVSESAGVPDLSRISGREIYKNKVENFIYECESYKDSIDLLENLYSDDRFDLLESVTQRVIHDIIPMVESAELNDCISYISNSNIGTINKDRLIETAKMYKSVDRIRKNHKNLIRRFSISAVYENNRNIKDKCFKVCEMVDTYDLTPFIKFNIALEELSYLGYMSGNKIEDKVLVENVSNYFLLRNDNTIGDIRDYKRAIIESKVLSESAGDNVNYLINLDYKKDSNYWKDCVNEWKINIEKDINYLVELTRDNCNNFVAITSIIETINDFTKINELEFNPSIIFNNISEAVDANQAANIINFIDENNITESEDLVNDLRNIWEAEMNDTVYDDGTKTPETFTSDEIDKFKMHNLIVDAQSAGEFIDHMEKTTMKESPLNIKKILSGSKDSDLNESNMIDHVDSNGYITMKIGSYSYEGLVEDAYNLVESAVNCINNILYNRDSVAYYTIGESYFDIAIRSKYKIILSEAQEISRGMISSERKIVTEIMAYREALEAIDNSPIYAIMEKLNDPYYASNISVDEAVLIYEILNPYIDKDNNIMKEFANLCEKETNPKSDKIKRLYSYMENEEFNILDDHRVRLEFCAEVMGIPIDEASNNKIKEKLDSVAGKIQSDANSGINAVKNKLNKNNPAEVKDGNPEELKKNNKDQEKNTKGNAKDNKNQKEQPKKEDSSKSESMDKRNKDEEGFEGKGTSLNDLKLAWQGVKSKAKKASAKEQELSRDMDVEFNHLLKTLKSTYGTDHREEIITGEVNHSLSKAIKIAISLAGLGVATAGLTGSALVAPIIGAIAIFAKSKTTSVKEKKLILDEIDIELQVLDREIERAQQSGSTKKYRQLLTIQKNIQRKRQEIYYGLAKKGQRVPMQSTAGLRARE